MTSSSAAGGDPPKALTRGLKDESAEVRATAVNCLLSYGQGLDPWVPILLRLAEHDPDPNVRWQCLLRMTDSGGFKPPAVTAAVVPELTTRLKSPDVNLRSKAAVLLREFEADAISAIPELIRVLSEPLDPRVMSAIGPDGIFDPGCCAARTLGRIAPGSAQAKEVITALIAAAGSARVQRGGSAAVALGEFGPAAKEAIPVLIKMINENIPGNNFERQSSAALALGKIAPESPSADQAVAALLPVLQAQEWVSRKCAIEALSRFGRRAAAAIPRIRELQNDRDHDVRTAAAKALVAIENASAP
jgi:HEAT repeat protein